VSFRILKSYINLISHKLQREKFKFSPFTVTDNSSTFGDYVNLAKVDVRQSEIGNFSYVSNGTKINRTKVGKFCSIGPRCLIGGLGKHPTNLISTHPVFYSQLKQASISFANKQYFEEFEETVIGNDVWIGANAIIIDGVSIGDGAIIASGAVVNKSVEPYAIVGGVPAKLIKKRFDDEEVTHLLNIQWWDWSLETLKVNANKFLQNKPLQLDQESENDQ
jgi:chloramphenicol O-acetyltransferase type B